MKCPKCNYTSFDYLDTCKKCGKDLTEHKEKHHIRSVLFAAGATAVAAPAAAAAGEDDFGFDFMEDDQAPASAAAKEKVLPVTEALPEPEDDPFGIGGGESGDDTFSFDSDDTFSFDDDEL